MTRGDLQEMIERGYVLLRDISPLWIMGLTTDFDMGIYAPKHPFYLSIWNELRRREIERATKPMRPIKRPDKDFFK